ncbi:hypothetical protein HN51_054437 [Arachis hypogaea]|uniref:histone-lysine N-methyltransferase EZA1 isoform X1 n=1 Tax=Arachis ipaensis TaxID=130454 RepID=UPI0007AF1E82|nr:histone-lysine N-methyltransferase EZA1 isoform X1 [Arachis ipaensis]XP_025677555.1 histone-lysine N-methyltransferase EZA1 isoform X1 [Arachis hypogaea]
MVSKTSDSASKLRKQHGESANDGVGGSLLMKINQLRKQIQAERIVFVKEKLKKNEKMLKCHTSVIMSAISSRESSERDETNASPLLSSRIDHPLCKFNAFSHGSGDKDHGNQDILPATTIKIPYVEGLPPYTSWIFLGRNQKMAEDQSVVGRRRIYYDQHGSEALICSDSEEELTEPEEEKHEFSEAEDRLLWMAFEEHGINEDVLAIVSQFVGGTSLEIQERYKIMKEDNLRNVVQHSEDTGELESSVGIHREKTLNAALDSFDNLFCRRCLVFDCQLHGCSQPLIYPCEKLTVWSGPEGDRIPCSEQCYLQSKVIKSLSENSMIRSFQDKKSTIMEEGNSILASSNTKESDDQLTMSFSTEVDCHEDLNINIPVSESVGKRKNTNHLDTAVCVSTLPPDDSQNSSKKQKRIANDEDITIIDHRKSHSLDACDEGKGTSANLDKSIEHASNKSVTFSSTFHGKQDKSVGDGPKDATIETEFKVLNPMEEQVDGIRSFSDWKPLEKELYLKGIEMFGRNSCLIARNLLSGLKTCMEIANYMQAGAVSMPHISSVTSNSTTDCKGKTDAQCMDQDIASRSRLLRKRGKTRKFKYSWKSAGHPSIWKRIADGKNQSCKQYTPCGCQSMCGKQCPCANVGNCCEKYCGCSKSCKNRFRGCHCAKSQCRSRQCPCFAAGRECDPDVCRNCWVSCGDGSLGEPPRRGDGQCGNMRLLLRQQQRILLAKSDIAGWGAFLKNPVNKNDYLGEYTGELISHREADKRGKIYDRANSSFLFDLNDQYVLDAYRKGDKLKFANHSSNPNCYAKVMLVAGDHRVGIFAKEHIDASEELFYDYRYGPDQAPPWARKPEASKRDESAVTQGRAKKHQSH